MTAGRLTPCLWFDHQAEEAARFYVSVFPGSSIDQIARYTDVGPGPKGSVMMVRFTLNGQPLMALNGGPNYTLTPAFSFVARCETQAELDALWERLSEGGQPIRCGWVTDRFGLSWQVVPAALPRLMADDDPEGCDRVMRAVLDMTKIDIRTLENAHATR